MRLALACVPIILAGCAHSTPIDPDSVLRIRGTEAQVAALLSDERARPGETVTLLSDTHGKRGVRELRYQLTQHTPYKEIGALVFYAQSHGAEIKFEKPR